MKRIKKIIKRDYTEEETINYLKEARDFFGNKPFMLEEDRVDQLKKFLGHLFFYCPEKYSNSVLATLEELERRDIYMYHLRKV